jgi:acetyl-CoA C-acetyltransferase
MRKAYLVAGKRTPIGTFMGGLSKTSAVELSAIATKAVLADLKLDPANIDEIYLGCVIQAGLGQNPARQVALASKIPVSVPNTLINKVCASGMKSLMIGAQSLSLGHNNVVLCGGFESMSQAPFLVKGVRSGLTFGNQQFIDSLATDGLTDPYNNCAMGVCGEKTADSMGITRELQDAYAIQSYERAINANKAGRFTDEIVAVPQAKGNPIAEDEEPKKFNREKMPSLKPAFSKTGTITAANASKLNDGACSLIIMNEEGLKKTGCKPIAEIVGYGDAEVNPIDFNIAPEKAAKVALKRAGLQITDVDFWEFNEAFSVTGLANMKLLGISQDKVNVNGGAVALGHPIGMSGARIVLTLANVLKQNNGKYGVAGICNGGGGASAVVLKNLAH